ncbi:SDR family oxidoreductase [Qipengyuania nanhaisediminis]|uniref:SDR family oxidoreductase n=1 Tax=Qipengyuania nanhaisediminis TaxID=604088 RepID=UPI0038B2E6E1
MSANPAQPAVLITGGAARIGAALSRGFACAGWHVVIHYRRSKEAAELLASELPSAETACCDLGDSEAVRVMAHDLAGRLGDWRCLVNSAAVFRFDQPRAISADAAREAVAVNALAPALLAEVFADETDPSRMRSVIQFTDMKLANPNPDFFSYSMSKHAASAAARMLAMASSDGLRVYALAPGAILASHDQSEAETAISHRLNLLERRTGLDEIVDAALFLASGALKSGSTLFVDSGQHLLSQPRDVIYLAREMAGAGA